MKDKIIHICIICIGLLLSGCASIETAMDVVRPANQEVKTENTGEVQIEETSDQYTVQRINRPVLLGGYQCTVYYDQVILDGYSNIAQKINSSIEEETNRWLAEAEASAETYLQHSSDDLFDTAELASVYNANDYLSVHMITSWFMGGVATSNPYSYTYSKQTGEIIPITKLLGKDISQIDAIYSQKCAEKGLNYSYTNYLHESDYKYYINEDGDIVIYFYTYEVADGSAGAFEFNIGNLNELNGVSQEVSADQEQAIAYAVGEFSVSNDNVAIHTEPDLNSPETNTLSSRDRNPIYEMRFVGIDLWIRVGDGQWVNTNDPATDWQFRFYDYDKQIAQMDATDFKGVYLDKDEYNWDRYSIYIIPVYYRDKTQVVSWSLNYPDGNNSVLMAEMTDFGPTK